MEAGQQTIDDLHTPGWRDHQVRPGVRCDDLSLTFNCRAFQRTHNGRSDGYDAASVALRIADGRGSTLRNPVFLGVRFFMSLEAGDAGVERQRVELDAMVRELLQHVWSERAPGGRHLR